MRIMRLLAIFAAALALGAAASAQLVSGYGAAWYGPLTPPFYGVGGYSGYNAANASDYDFYNVGAGPFYWYSLGSGQTLPASPSMVLNGTTLTVAQVDGNSSTATALAAIPTQCAAGSYVTGIQANGNANCSAGGGPAVEGALNTTGCTTGGSSYDVCTMSVTWATPFADTNYAVSCTGEGPTDSGNPTSGRAVENGITSKTTTGVTVQFATTGANAISYTGMDCTAIHL